MYGYIYETTNLINGKKYIGKRVKKAFDKNYKGSGKVLKQAIEKYGWDNFECKIIQECLSKEKLEEREKYWISFYNAVDSNLYYNISFGGTGGGHCLSEEVRKSISERMSNNNPAKRVEVKEKMSIAKLGKSNGRKGIPLSEETKRKISESHKGLKQNQETIEKRRQKMIGHKTSDETKLKIGNKNRGKVQSEESKEKNRRAHLGKKLGPPSQETRNKISVKNKDKIYVSNNKETLRICRKELDSYINLGYHRGRR